MKRKLYTSLVRWKDDPGRKPLIIRGARQVGKTWLVREFGEHNFESFFEINFELNPHFKSCFNDIDPDAIIQKIELTANVTLTPGKTLLFLDEIQECPAAIKSLRYFFENYPTLHVIAAGSLLEFLSESDTISIPVGRVQNFYLFPLSFPEFLYACNEIKLHDFLLNVSVNETIPEPVHLKCINLLKLYLYTGGMPEAVSSWLQTNKLQKIDEIYQALIQNYRQDFGKYGKKISPEILETVFNKAPGVIGTKLKYTNISRNFQSREIKKALFLLFKANILYKINATSGSGLPMLAHTSENKFKLLMLDVGLLQNLMGISKETYLSDNILAVYRGMIAEQFAGQQLLSLQKSFHEPSLFYWQREAKGSEAEVDYLYQCGEKILPLEVKAGSTGSLKSLRIFLDDKKAPFGIRLSLNPLSFTDSVLSVPLYAVDSLPGLVEKQLKS